MFVVDPFFGSPFVYWGLFLLFFSFKYTTYDLSTLVSNLFGVYIQYCTCGRLENKTVSCYAMFFPQAGIFILGNLAIVAHLVSSFQCLAAKEFSSLLCELLRINASQPMWFSISSDFACVWSSMDQDLCLQEKWGASSSTSDMALSLEISGSIDCCCKISWHTFEFEVQLWKDLLWQEKETNKYFSLDPSWTGSHLSSGTCGHSLLFWSRAGKSYYGEWDGSDILLSTQRMPM